MDVRKFYFLKLVNTDHIMKIFLLMSKDMVAWRKKKVVELTKDAVKLFKIVNNDVSYTQSR